MYARVNLKMKKPRLCCCVTWILVNNCISVNKETWYNWFSGKVGDEGFLKMGVGFPSNGQMILKWDGWYPFTLKNRIIDYLEKCGLFSDFQYGFRSSHSTADLLTVESDKIARAFNKVWHAGLLG